MEKRQPAPSLPNPSCLHRAEHSVASAEPLLAEAPASTASRDQPTQMFAENMDYSWVLLLECYLNLISQTYDSSKRNSLLFLGDSFQCLCWQLSFFPFFSVSPVSRVPHTRDKWSLSSVWNLPRIFFSQSKDNSSPAALPQRSSSRHCIFFLLVPSRPSAICGCSEMISKTDHNWNLISHQYKGHCLWLTHCTLLIHPSFLET